MGPRCGRCKFDEDPRSYMRDDTECEQCTGREGPAIMAASVLVPVAVIGVPLAVMRIEHTRAFAYKFYHRFIDVGKFKARARRPSLSDGCESPGCARRSSL